MKTLVGVLLVIAVSVLALLAINFSANNQRLEREIAEERAVFATGPCGNQFLVAGLGKNKDEVVVAGSIMKAEEAGRYFTRETRIADSPTSAYVTYEEVWRRDENDKEFLVFRRPKPSN